MSPCHRYRCLRPSVQPNRPVALYPAKTPAVTQCFRLRRCLLCRTERIHHQAAPRIVPRGGSLLLQRVASRQSLTSSARLCTATWPLRGLPCVAEANLAVPGTCLAESASFPGANLSATTAPLSPTQPHPGIWSGLITLLSLDSRTVKLMSIVSDPRTFLPGAILPQSSCRGRTSSETDRILHHPCSGLNLWLCSCLDNTYCSIAIVALYLAYLCPPLATVRLISEPTFATSPLSGELATKPCSDHSLRIPLALNSSPLTVATGAHHLV